MTDALWTSDFRIAGREVTVKKTGARVVIDREVARSALKWLAWYIPVRAVAAMRTAVSPGPKIWFAPDRPRPWYLVWAAAAWAGAQTVATPGEADAAFCFEDATFGRALRATELRCFNSECLDVSKSRVATVFEQVFGYPLAIDPAITLGLAVEKGEANGVHDGRIVCLPRPATPGRVYQRLVDNVDGGEAVDLRTPFVGGKPVLVFVKRRPVERRFENMNTRVALARPTDVFSLKEIRKLEAFAQAMKLDWGGLDILRDAVSGRIYVVDVNKTDMPPLALPWIDKLRATHRLARAFSRLIAS